MPLRMPEIISFLFSLVFAACGLLPAQTAPIPAKVFGYRDFGRQAGIDREFLAIPDVKLAQQELKTLTAAPHVAGSKEDYATALYVADKFKAAGLETQIVEYKAWMNLPQEVYIQAVEADGTVLMTGPVREHVDNDPFQDDPRILPAFNGSSPSGDVTADVVYANYGRPEDFKTAGRNACGRPRQARAGSLRSQLSRSQGLPCAAARRSGSDHLLRSGGRRLFPRRPISQGPVAPGHGRTARIGPIPLQISRGRHNARHRIHPGAARHQNGCGPPRFKTCLPFPQCRSLTTTLHRSCSISEVGRRRGIGRGLCRSPTTLAEWAP